MLTVSRKRVQEVYDKYCHYVGFKLQPLLDLFGSKCLPDKEPKPAEPKFKKGDAVTYQGIVYTIYDGDGIYGLKDVFGNLKDGAVLEQDLKPYDGPKYHVGQKVRYLGQNHEIGEIAAYYEDEPGRYSVRFGREYHNILESMLEPYAEPTENVNLSQDTANCDKQFDNILKDGFREHNRLHIAAMLAAGMLANDSNLYPIDRALELADKLIAQCGKGGSK